MLSRTILIVLVSLIVAPTRARAEAPAVNILSVASGKAIDAHADDVAKNGCRMQLWTPTNGQNQRWLFVPIGEGYFHIVSAASGLVLDAHAADAKKNHCRVQLWEAIPGNLNQARKFIGHADKSFELLNAQGLYLDAELSQVGQNGCKLQLYARSGAANQRWRFGISKNQLGVKKSSFARYYGNYGGLGNTGQAPVDRLDEAYKRHDESYDKRGFADGKGDAQVIEEMFGVVTSGHLGQEGMVKGPVSAAYFYMMPRMYQVKGGGVTFDIPVGGGPGKLVLYKGEQVLGLFKNPSQAKTELDRLRNQGSNLVDKAQKELDKLKGRLP